MLRENFVGHVKPINHPDVAYRVFFINDLQRETRFQHCEEFWKACQQAGPIWSVSFDGVPYAWIYRAYPQDPGAFAIDHRLDVQLGDHIRLLGYRLSSADRGDRRRPLDKGDRQHPGDLSAGDALTVTLFWQSDGQLDEDYHVFVHLLGEEGLLAAQHDGVPMQNKRPTWTWRDIEVLQDEHALVTDVSQPEGTYTLSVGMYDYLTKARLPAVGPDGERLPEDRVVLQDVRVASP